MTKTLFKHQKDAIEGLRTGSILLGPVGSGKSITALAYVYNKVCGGSIDPIGNPDRFIKIYVITTAKKRDSLDWIGEAAYFGIQSRGDDFITIQVDSWNNIGKYLTVKDAFFIFDEQRVIGSGAWAKAFIKIAKNNNWLLLTATPGDTWLDYIPVFIANGFYKHKTDFLRQHVIFNSFVSFPKVDRYINEAKLIKHRRQVMVKMKYRRVVERHHISLEIPHDETLLRTVVRDRWNPFKEKPAVNAAEACYIMRQVVNSHPGRLKVVDELVRRHKRIILFYNFNYELYRLRELGKKHNIGEYNGHKHQGIPQTSEWLYLVQYTSGAEAWNCIDTNVIVFFSLNYSYKTMIQASGRIDRMNSPFSELYYYYLVSNSTIDKSIMRTIKDKGIFNEREFLTKQGLVFSSQEKHML